MAGRLPHNRRRPSTSDKWAALVGLNLSDRVELPVHPRKLGFTLSIDEHTRPIWGDQLLVLPGKLFEIRSPQIMLDPIDFAAVARAGLRSMTSD